MITATEFSKFLASRRSTRDFAATPVPAALVDQLLTDAMTAPSWSNTRPYLVAVASGEVRNRISADLTRRWQAATKMQGGGILAKLAFAFKPYAWPNSGFKFPYKYPAPFKGRAGRVGKEMYGLIGVPRGDKAARDAQWGRNYKFFGAPTVLFVFSHKALGVFGANDAGLFAQNLMLSAHAHGLGAVAQGSVTPWPGAVLAEFDIPEDYKLLYAIALGYPTDATINTFGANRLDIAEIKAPLKPGRS